jgi:thymidylate kinase
MVDHTQYRLFTAYSDPMARELGTIYQACNWYYLGQRAGATVRYVSPYTGKVVSDRFFRQRTAYRHYARELGLDWDRSWVTPTGMAWANVPPDVEAALRQRSRDVQAAATPVTVPPKHKYALVLGRDRSETRRLRRLFEERNRTFPYPKVRC